MALINKENSVLQNFFFKIQIQNTLTEKIFDRSVSKKKNQYKTLEKNIAQDEPPKYLLEFR